MGKKRYFTGNNHGLYLTCCLGLIFFVAGCYHRAPRPVPPAAGPGIEACRHTGGFREMVYKGLFKQAERENNRVKECLDHFSEKDSLSTALLKQEVEIYAMLLDRVLVRDKQNRDLSQSMVSMAKTAKKLKKKIKAMDKAREKDRENAQVRFLGVERENERLKQQIKSYKAIDLGLDTIKPKPGDTVGQ
ncbi:MAG: hypothetical protein GY737_06385 [Desulfobacteraceae bacterium]|nr:hypothetical protein [Desulfobacteraceae bacterium]